MKNKTKEICQIIAVIIFVGFLVGIALYITVIGVGAIYYGGLGFSGIVDNVTLLPDQGDRFDVYLINFTDRSSKIMFLPPYYNITIGFKHWFQGENQGDYYQAHTILGTFRKEIYNCMAVYDNPGSHKALYVKRGITMTYSDHYIFPEND